MKGGGFEIRKNHLWRSSFLTRVLKRSNSFKAILKNFSKYIPKIILSSHAAKFGGNSLSVTLSLQLTWNGENDFSLRAIFLAWKSNAIKVINLKNQVIVSFVIIWNVKEFPLQNYLPTYFEKCKQLLYEQIWLMFWLTHYSPVLFF